jgi:hypothetical protein
MEGTCLLKGCNRPVFQDTATGETYRFCGRTHGHKYEEEAAQAAGRPKCKLPGCERPVYYDSTAGVTHDNCGRTHAKAAGEFQRPLRINASQNALESVGGKLCRLPGCSRGVCIEGNKIHNFCSRTHAMQMEQRTGPQMKPGHIMKDQQAIRWIADKHDERQAHNLPPHIFTRDAFACDPWLLPEVQVADRTVEDWLYWQTLSGVGKRKRETGGDFRWKPATGKVTPIKESNEEEIGTKKSYVYAHKGPKHLLGYSDGPTTATKFRWWMTEYKAHGDQLQDWALVCISKAEVPARSQEAGEAGTSGQAEADQIETGQAQGEDQSGQSLLPTPREVGESYRAQRSATRDLSPTEDVAEHFN